jgi:hypothetical protein
VIVVDPEEELRSGLLKGFFFPNRMREDFELGRHRAETLLNAFAMFEAGKDDALDALLLDYKKLKHVGDDMPKLSWWALWANTKWLA